MIEITTDDLRDTLKAYGRETDPIRKFNLYKAVRARWDDLLDMPLRATDTYAGDLVVQRTLELLKVEFPMLGAITTDFSAESGRLNQNIVTRIVTPPAVADYHTSNGYVAASTTTEDVVLTITRHRHATVSFNANVLGSTHRALFGEQLPAMHYNLGKDIVETLYALITDANYTEDPTVEAAANFDRSTVLTLGSKLTARGVPSQGRTLLLNSTYYNALLADTTIALMSAYRSPEILTAGRLPNVNGFDVFEAANLPTTGNLCGFAFSRSAMVLATRVPNDVSAAFPGVTGGGATRVITNPDTGLSVLMIQAIDHLKGSASMILAVMYGVALGQQAAGQLLLSAEPES